MISDVGSIAWTQYLADEQQHSLQRLTQKLQDALKCIPVAQARLILKIFESARGEVSQEEIERFFLALIEDETNLQKHLEKLLQIIEKNEGKTFFTLASTRKKIYYSTKQLQQIIQDFYQAIEQSLVAREEWLAPYDAGGKEKLDRLLKQKRDTSSSHVQARQTIVNSQSDFEVIQSRTMNYLFSLANQQRLSYSFYQEVFCQIQDEMCLKNYEKASLMKLILVLTSAESVPFSIPSKEDVQELLQQATSVHQRWGEELLTLFCQTASSESNLAIGPATNALRLLSILPQKKNPYNLLSLWNQKQLSWDQLLNQFEKAFQKRPFDPLGNEEDLTALIRRFQGQDRSVAFPIAPDQLKVVLEQFLLIQSYCVKWKEADLSMLVKLAQEVGQEEKSAETLGKLFAIGRLAIRQKYQIYPYPTQIITALGILMGKKGRIGQVKTGEGKSTIVTLLAFVLTLQGESVHVISSSPYLAKRDCRKYAPFFKAFGMETSHICEENQEPIHFRGQILYGTVDYFKFAVMREQLEFKQLFPKTDLPLYPLIDELDNLTIDTFLNSARIAYPAEVFYDWVYQPIYQFVSQYTKATPLQEVASPTNCISLRQILEQHMGGKFKQTLKSISDEQVKKWLESAYQAHFVKKEKKDYVILDRPTPMGKKKKQVVIIDRNNTGKRLEGCRWGQGVHEFVEIKSGLEVEKENLNPISLSHAVYYERYDAIYGLTGTLGTEIERNEMQEIYGIDSFDVPPHCPVIRQDAKPIVCDTKVDYFQTVIDRIDAVRKRGRPVLVFCRSIDRSEKIGALLKGRNISHQVFNDIQEEDEEEVIAKAGQAGIVTIATNTAGRGVDFLLSKESLQNGGLHVLFTFYPESDRVREQGVGRAGRQAQPGSSDIILFRKQLKGMSLDGFLANVKQKAIEQKQHHCRRAEMERYSYRTYTAPFFVKLGLLHGLISNPLVINQWAAVLVSRRLFKPPSIKWENFSLQEREMGQTALTYLTSKQSVTPLQWETLLKHVGEWIEKQVIQSWALNFFQPLETLMVYGEQNSLDLLKLSIQHLFEGNKDAWEGYMDAKGGGFTRFFNKLIQVDLSDVFVVSE